MPPNATPDAVVVGSGPNGLAAAITLARAGLTVTVFEEYPTIGGGTRTEELTLPGFWHDVCSAVHPLGVASPFFLSLPLHEHGLEWIYPEVQLAHPLPDGTSALLYRSLDKTAELLGSDGRAYLRLMSPLVRQWAELAPDLLAPLHYPQHPIWMLLFGLRGLVPAKRTGEECFKEPAGRALFAGMSAHSFLPLDEPLSSAFGLVLGALGHVAGWPVAKGGSRMVSAALASYFRSLGGEIVTDAWVASLNDLPKSSLTMLDLAPRQLLRIDAPWPDRYRDKLEAFRYGPGVFKIDWALDAPIPWASEGCRRSATVHVAGTSEELARAEREVSEGKPPQHPFVLLAQPTLFDPGRAPSGKHVGWAYCHVPHSSTVDMTERIEAQVERFAPGFRSLVLARHTYNCVELERYNRNLIGGDISGGVQDLRQFLARPKLFSPYRTPIKGHYLCSSSTPPGGGVHGMCGYHAATLALEDLKAEKSG